MKILVVGYGSVGKRHIQNISNIPDTQIIVCTKRPKDKFLKLYGCQVFNSLDLCIKQKPDAAIIANVSSSHLKTAIKLAKSKIHLFIEKPLSNSLHDTKTLLTLVKKFKLTTLMGCQLRFHPCLKTVKQLLQKNKVGRILYVQAENGSFLPDWHPYEDYRISYAARKELGGGAVLTCIHEIDYLYWLFGNPINIVSKTAKISNLEINTEDIAEISMRFKKDIIAHLHLDYFQKPQIRACRIIGTKGTIEMDLLKNTVKLYAFTNKKWSTLLNLPRYNYNSAFAEEISYFVNCVNGNKQTENSVFDGLEVLKIALMGKNEV